MGLAFGLVFIAGAASMIGFLPVLWLKRTKAIYLAFALGFAAGLMMYVHVDNDNCCLHSTVHSLCVLDP